MTYSARPTRERTRFHDEFLVSAGESRIPCRSVEKPLLRRLQARPALNDRRIVMMAEVGSPLRVPVRGAHARAHEPVPFEAPCRASRFFPAHRDAVVRATSGAAERRRQAAPDITGPGATRARGRRGVLLSRAARIGAGQRASQGAARGGAWALGVQDPRPARHAERSSPGLMRTGWRTRIRCGVLHALAVEQSGRRSHVYSPVSTVSGVTAARAARMRTWRPARAAPVNGWRRLNASRTQSARDPADQPCSCTRTGAWMTPWP